MLSWAKWKTAGSNDRKQWTRRIHFQECIQEYVEYIFKNDSHMNVYKITLFKITLFYFMLSTV